MPRQRSTDDGNSERLYIVFIVLTILFLVAAIVFKYLEIHNDYQIF